MTSRVLLYWLPLGAGRTTGCVRSNGRVYERIVAAREGREACDLYHAAVAVWRLDTKPHAPPVVAVVCIFDAAE